MRWRRRAEEQSHEDAAAGQIAELVASRRIIVDAYEVERRRLERDLHDGTQQYLVAAAMKLGEAALSPSVEADPALAALIDDARATLMRGLEALRTTVRGIHPSILSERGLAAALDDVAAAAAGEVRIVVPNPLPDLPEGVLASGYFFAAEAIANAAKYAPGAPVTVLLTADEALRISVVDGGPGGARIIPGHGLAGLRERLAAFGGTIDISSPEGGPTQVVAALPLLLRRGEPGVQL